MFKAQGTVGAECEKKCDGVIKARLEEYLMGLVRRFLATLESVALNSKSTAITSSRVESTRRRGMERRLPWRVIIES